MNGVRKNKKLYTKIWKTKKLKSHKFWVTWNKFKELIPRKSPKLLDIGCGVRPRFPVKNSYFLDLSKSALDTLEQNGGICHCGDATTLPYKSNFFDFVNASELLEHIEEDEKVFSEVNRVLKSNAYFSFSVPLHMKHWTKFDDLVHHVRRYEARELQEKIGDSGFKIKHFYLNGPATSRFYKNICALMLSTFPNLSFFIEEHILMPITEKLQRSSRREWHTQGFVKKLENTGGVIYTFPRNPCL
ncbi:class I SAM-dependent methyltransferase [Patescibacteria group bacterium]